MLDLFEGLTRCSIVQVGLDVTRKGSTNALGQAAIEAVEQWLDKPTEVNEAACKRVRNSIFFPEPTQELEKAYIAGWLAAAVGCVSYDRAWLARDAALSVRNVVTLSSRLGYLTHDFIHTLPPFAQNAALGEQWFRDVEEALTRQP